MTSKWLVVLLAVVSAVQLAANGDKHEVAMLSPDAEVVTIQSENFKITIEMCNKSWKAAKVETDKVETPRGTSEDKDEVIVNTDLSETNEVTEIALDEGEGAKPSPKQRKHFLSADLYDWIKDRAAKLSGQTERYLSDLKRTKNSDDKIILQILFLNTLVDLQNIAKEKSLKKIKWIGYKLTDMLPYKAQYEDSVRQWVQSKIDANIKIEAAHRGSNEPKADWFINLQAVKRVLHEQRFSKELGTMIVDYLGGTFGLMTRGHLFQRAKKPNKEGLVYSETKRRIPPYFSFSSQYALVNGPRRMIIDKLLWFKTY